jgi:hypothetical protein
MATRRCIRPRSLAGLGLAVALVSMSGASAQQVAVAGATPFEPSTASADARAAFDEGLDTWIRFRVEVANSLYASAASLDPRFALPRALGVGRLPFGEREAELDAALLDATRGSTTELLLVAAVREDHRGNAAAARTLRRAAADLTTDPRLRLYVAWSLPIGARKPILYALHEERPDDAPAAAALAWALVPNVFVTVGEADLAAAERAARAAVRSEPDAPYARSVLAQVLTRTGDRAEARRQLELATSGPTYLVMAYQQLAQLDLQDGRVGAARAILERALAAAESEAERRSLREAIALTHLHDGDLDATLRGYEALAADADAQGFEPAAGSYYASAAIVAAGAGDARRFDRYRLEADRRLQPSANLEWRIIGPALLGRGDEAAVALERHLEVTEHDRSAAAEESRERMRGYVELARDRPAVAVAHFQRGGRNPYTQLGLWEAQLRLGDEAAARAVRDDLLTRKDFGLFSTATPTARYRANRPR